MNNTHTKTIVMASLFASLCCVLTMIIKIPSPLKGYINLGDCVVLLSGWLLSPAYSFLAAGIGSALADMFSGYVIYAPVTFIIKGVMAITAFYCFKLIYNRMPKTLSRIVSGTISEIIMIVGYFIFEGFMYGWAASSVNILPNAVQGTVGLILGIVFVNMFEKNNILL